MDERRRRLLYAAVWLLFAFLVGTAGYYLLGQGRWSLIDCAYMTATTLTTVGYREIVPVSDVPGGVIFNIFMLLGGVATLFYFATNLMAFVVEGDLRRLLGRKRMEKRTSRLRDHVIVCGSGRTGRHAVMQLSRANHQVLVVDRDENAIRDFFNRHNLDLPFLVGDATEEGVLQRANIETAFGVICALDSDQSNLYVVLTARGLNPKLRIVAKCSDHTVGDKFKQVGADSVVAPSELGGRRLFVEMTQPATMAFLESLVLPQDLGLHVREVPLGAASALIGRTLAEADLRRQVGNVLILGIKEAQQENYTYTPKSTCRLSPGATLMAMGGAGEIEKLRELAR